MRTAKQRAQFMSDLYDIIAGNDEHITLEEFQDKWLRGCMSIDDTSGIIQIDNTLITIIERK